MIDYFVVALALFGAYLNASNDPRGFVLWMFTNSYLCIKNLSNDQYAQGLLFAAYFGLSVYGYLHSQKNSSET